MTGGNAVILHGDCRDILPTLPEASVQCVVTSPPYWGLRDYGVDRQIGLEKTPEEYVATMVAVFREVRRVLRDDGTLWLNLGDSYANTGKSGGGEQGARWAQMGGRTDECKGTFKYAPPGLKPKDLVGIPWRVAFALQADGWWLRSDIIWAKPNPMPESVTDRPTKAHEYVFLLTKSARYFYDAEALMTDVRGGGKTRKGPIYSAPASAFGIARKTGNMADDAVWTTPTRANARSVWTIATEPTPEAHFATFPRALADRCILAGSRMGDTVLDPFGGSGTVGVCAEALGRHSILIELSPDYVAMATRRTAQRGLFTQAEGG